MVVNEKLNAPKDYRREIRQALYYCNKFGVREHLSRIGESCSADSYLRRLSGKVNYVLQIDPRNEESLKYKAQIPGMIRKLK